MPISPYHHRRLSINDAPVLQRLYERCSDYHELEEGVATVPHAGERMLRALPEGKDLEDKFVFGVFTPQQDIVGMIDLIRDHPTQGEWWIGLLMFDPAVRGAGLGEAFLTEMVNWVAAQNGTAMYIAVLEQNPKAQRFWGRQGFVERWRQSATAHSGQVNTVIGMRKDLA
jgi:RimJ/RimL family protein N-acetyltransferase